MKRLFLLLFVSHVFMGNATSKNSTPLNLIPLPQECTVKKGVFTVDQNTRIILSPDIPEMQDAVAIIKDLFSTAAGITLSGNAQHSNTISCKLNTAIAGDEAYQLSVAQNTIRVEAKTPRGIFYAMQTLRQLLPPEIEMDQLVKDVAWTIPCVEIKDQPRYGYRGLMLDCCRHFTTKENVKRFIDLLAYHKMNTFHWHLTEDQGWRIEIKKYPKLTEIGAFRNRTLKGAYVAPALRQWDNTRYGGFYTQDDIKEVVAYAQKRFVTIIPEIEMPGHAVAALASYPNLSCTGGPFEVEGLWGVFNDIYCTRDEVFDFLEGVLDEVCELFPSEYIHIGGDEAPKVRWQRCAACQDRMKKEGLKDEHELQSYFVKRIASYLATKGKKIIGWDEIMEGGLAPGATVMSWRGMEGGIAAAKLQHPVIMSPNSHAYLDYYQANPKTEPHAIGGYLPIWKVYSCEPTPAELTTEEAKFIAGIQGNVWTEYISTFDHVLYMAYPRAAAIAEIGWTPKNKKNYDDFHSRLIPLLKRYDAMGINYSKTTLLEPRN